MCLQFQETQSSAQLRCLVTGRCSLPPTLSSCGFRLCRLYRPLLAEQGCSGMLYRRPPGAAGLVQLLQTHTPFSCCSPHSLVQMNMLSFPKAKSECSSLCMVKSSFHTSTLSTLRCCQFGFTWQDPFLSSLFPALCPTAIH